MSGRRGGRRRQGAPALTSDALRRSPLDDAHRALGAKMAPFAGWEMPIEYGGTLSEHAAVRGSVGLFDVSHLGKLFVSGEGAAALLDRLLTNRFSDLAAGRARYTLILQDDGGIVDDLIVYALEDGRYLAVPNAANADEVEARFREAAPPGVRVERADWATIAVQGPRSTELVERFPGASTLRYMGCAISAGAVVARSGYTGEVGYEVFAPPERAPALWDELLSAARERGGAPCGLGARDTLRLEMGYPLHGNDIDRRTTPAEAGLEWAVDERKEFVGRDAIRQRTPRTRLRGLLMQGRLIPRRGHPVLAGARELGRVTSGTFSPTLRVGIALAALRPGSVEDGEVEDGEAVEVDVRGRRGAARVVTPPFVDRSPKG